MSASADVLLMLSTGGKYSLEDMAALLRLPMSAAWKAIQDLRLAGYEIEQMARPKPQNRREPIYVYHLISKEPNMTPNLSEIQARLMSLAHTRSKEQNISLGRAIHAVADELGPTLEPPMTGDQLERWLAAQRSKIRYAKKVEKVERPAPEEASELLVVEETVPAMRNGTQSLVVQQMVKALAKMPRGTTWSIMTEDEEAALELHRNLNRVSQLLNWHKGLPANARAYETEILPDRLRITRR